MLCALCLCDVCRVFARVYLCVYVRVYVKKQNKTYYCIKKTLAPYECGHTTNSDTVSSRVRTKKMDSVMNRSILYHFILFQ